MRFKYSFFIFLGLTLVVYACSTKKNTVIHRAYHNMTARYNGYYYATESIKDAVTRIEQGNKDDYDKILPVFVYPTNESAKATFPDFDKSIKKSSLVIQRHTIRDSKGNEIPTAGKWIDNNWNVIGISHFYKREFFSGIEAFEYVMRTYKKGDDRYVAMLWMAKSYNEIGSVSMAEPIISVMKNDKNFPKRLKKDLAAVEADYFLRRGLYQEAAKALNEAIDLKPKKKVRARYTFILAQLYERERINSKAIQFYRKTIALKPNYDMVFNAEIKQARLVDVKHGGSAKVKRQLLKMTKDVKNIEYLDVIYYTLGEIEEHEKNMDMAMTYYRKSAKSSTSNLKQKALSYLRLGEISFDRSAYTDAGNYYDSTMATLPKDYPDYDAIANRKTTLETLIGHIRTVQNEDSLQRVAKMPETARNRFIDQLIQRMDEEEERKKEEAEALAQNNQTPQNNGQQQLPGNGGATGAWYFYNQTTLSFGINDFVKKWGNRKLEDNWRRSQKGVVLDPLTTATATPTDSSDTDGTAAGKPKKNKANDKHSREYYLKDLPLTDSLIDLSNKRIVEAYYNMGSIYKEALNNNKKAIATFEELDNRFPTNKYLLSDYYQLYRLYTAEKNQSKADFYKNKLLNEYPNSDYAKIIQNPNYFAEKNAEKGEVESYYTATYMEYSNGKYATALDMATTAQGYGNNEYAARFAYIKAMCIGKLKGEDSLVFALKQLMVTYPRDPIVKSAGEVIMLLQNKDNPEGTPTAPKANTDTFQLNLNSTHFVIALFADNNTVAKGFISNLTAFNTKYYSNGALTVSSNLFGGTNQIAIVKTFKNAEAAMSYLSNLSNDPDVFQDAVKRELFSFYVISSDNLPILYKRKNIAVYKPFYDDHYKPVK